MSEFAKFWLELMQIENLLFRTLRTEETRKDKKTGKR